MLRPLVMLVRVFTPWENDRANLRRFWVQSNGVVAHIEVQGCCKSEFFQLLQHCSDFRYWKRFILTILLFSSLKSLMKHTVPSFLGVMNDGEAQGEFPTLFITPSSTKRSNSFLWFAYGPLEPDMASHDTALRLPLIQRRQAESSNHLGFR
jgi:hypothetical protein